MIALGIREKARAARAVGGEYHKENSLPSSARARIMTTPSESLLHYIRRLTRPSENDAGDAVLLQRFTSQGDEAAFTALLARHGPMVMGVCRRILRDSHDAEDAFQATFLVLARKAGTLRRPEGLASWLYGTARHLASTARRAESRRHQREACCLMSAASAPQGDLLDDLSARELLLALDEELGRLPEAYRLPLILCHLEGRTHEEAGRLLGWTAGSVKGRLERGRKQLHARLSRRGLALGAGLLAMESMTSATVSAALRQATAQRALTFAAGSAESISANVLALAETGLTSMTMTKAKLGLILLLALGFAGGAGLLAYPLGREQLAEEQQATAARIQERKTETPKPASDKAAPTDLYGDPLPAGAIARLGTIRFRHGGWLTDVLLSPDGRTLISAGRSSVEIWDAQTGRRKRKITFSQALPHFVSGIDVSPDGKLLAVNHYQPNKMRFWSLVSGAEVHPFGDAAPEASRAAFSPNGQLLATLDSANPATISIWDIRRGKKLQTMEGGGTFAWYVRPLAFSPNSKLLAFPRDTGILVWDIEAGKELYRLDPDTKTPQGAIVFSADGKLLAAASNPQARVTKSVNAIHLWDMATGKQVGMLKGHEARIMALSVSPKDNILAWAGRDGIVRFWDLAKRQELGQTPASLRDYFALQFSADGSRLVSGEYNGVIRLWDVQTPQPIARELASVPCVNWVAFAPDGQTLISATQEQIGLWEPLSGRPRRTFSSRFARSYHAALSPDGKILATADWEHGQALLWDVADGKLVRRFGEGSQPSFVPGCTFSADGRLLATASSRDNIIRIWDVASGKEAHQLKGQKFSQPIAFAPDGATLVSASTDAGGDYTVRLWKLATGEEIWRKVTRPWTAFDLRFSPDGRTLALVGGLPGRLNTTGEVRLWEAATGKELKHFEGHRERVGCVAFSSDGRMLATGSQDNTVRLWEIATGQERRCFQGHQQMISAVSFSPDGRLLASASADTTALVWDLTGRFRDGRFQPRRLSAEELERYWNDLAHADATRAYHSIVALTGSPKEAVPFLKDRLPPLSVADSKRVAPLLVALDSEQFAERDKAMAELEKLGLAVEPALRAALNAKPSLEVRRRIETVLEKLASGPRLRFLRAMEILENIAAPEARQVLEIMSQGPTELWPTHEARASVRRMKLRSAPNP